MAQINIRVDEELKQESTKILNELGMDVTTAIKVFLKQVVLQEKIPFSIQTRQSEVAQALEDIEKGNTQKFADIKSLMEDLND